MNRRMRRIGSLLICFALILGISLTAVSKDFSIFDVAAEGQAADIVIIEGDETKPQQDPDEPVQKDEILRSVRANKGGTVWEFNYTKGILTVYQDVQNDPKGIDDVDYTAVDLQKYLEELKPANQKYLDDRQKLEDSMAQSKADKDEAESNKKTSEEKLNNEKKAKQDYINNNKEQDPEVLKDYDTRIGSYEKSVKDSEADIAKYTSQINDYDAKIKALDSSNKELVEKKGLIEKVLNAGFPNFTVNRVVYGEGVTKIRNTDLPEMYDLTKVVVANTVETVEDGAFRNWNLNTVGPTLEDYDIQICWNKNVPDEAFKNCDNITAVAFKDGVKTIGKKAFYDCDSLSSVKFPETLQTIFPSAFENCDSLNYVVIPASTIAINSKAFAYTQRDGKKAIPSPLTDVYFACEQDSIDIASDTFSGLVKPTGHVLYGLKTWDVDALNGKDFKGGKTWTWKYYDVNMLVGLTADITDKYYLTGDSLDFESLTLKAEYVTGFEEEIPVLVDSGRKDQKTGKKIYEVNPELRFTIPGDNDFTKTFVLRKAERKQISVAYRNVSTTFEVYVHDPVEQALTNLPESAHNYKANAKDEQIIKVEDARQITFTFSDKTETEPKNDYIWIYDNNGKLQEKLTGKEAAGKKFTVMGDEVKIVLTSDGNDERYGYAITKATAIVPKHVAASLDKENKDATCTEDGLKGHACCEICGKASNPGEVIPALGHDFDADGVCTRCGYDRLFGENELARIWGDNRFDTAYAIADQLKIKLGVDKFDAIIVAYSENFPDSLTASYLAVKKNAPIILADSIKNNGATAAVDYIKANLKAGGTIYVLGGDNVVSADFVKTLNGLGTVKQLNGNNRYDTNQMILDEAGAPKDEVIICTGENYIDALTASATGKAILIVNDQYDLVKNDVMDYIKTNVNKSAKVYIVGGYEAISHDFQNELADLGYINIKRIPGDSRFETSVNVAKYFYGDVKNLKTIGVAWSEDFADALCAGPFCYQYGAPLLLVADTANAKVYTDAGFPVELAKVIGFGGIGTSNNQLTDKAMNLIKLGDITDVKYQANLNAEKAAEQSQEVAPEVDTSKLADEN